MLKEGTKAPEFSLEDQNGKVVKLNDFEGQKVLIWFYPKASTPG
jgi:peroxiredoxin Q/BCP